MKAFVINSTRNRGKSNVEIRQGNQAFRLDYHATRSECEWMARMFNEAVERHNGQRGERWQVRLLRKLGWL